MNQISPIRAAFDQTKAEVFVEDVANIINNGAIAVMMSIGHRTGLFDIMARIPGSTSDEIAHASALNERYVREWLAVMVTGGIVEYAAADKSYTLPAHHAAALTRGAPLGNMAVYAQFVALAGAMQDNLMTTFETGDGIEYSDYPCFHQIMSEDSSQTVAAGIREIIEELDPALVERLEAGIDVLDAGCGAGATLVAMAGIFPNSRFTGYDLCTDAVKMAESKKAAAGTTNVTFEKRDLSSYDAVEAFDLITSFDAVHDTKNPQQLLHSYHRALKPGGTYIMQDIGGSAYLENNMEFPFAAFLYSVSCMHCMPVSLAQGGEGLGTMWGWETALGMLENAGFVEIKRNQLEHDPMNVWFVSRK